ncbi:MAG: beta-eliminating lyase-related protein [Bdellovibrionota bacterium]|nr:threonine aldolase [Pseudobdellovibrionaceae bacterium]|tara:strand:+ start:13001 stop:14056 length:1056 start_codon:yes stop_codon:yes gene_type:complete
MDLSNINFSKSFTSDNNSGVLPEVMEILSQINQGHLPAYGREGITQLAVDRIKDTFSSRDAEVYFVFNGTAANVCALQAMSRSFHSVLCSSDAHIHVDECGSPEKIAGLKVLNVDCQDAKLKPEHIDQFFVRRGDPHCSQLKIVSLTQPTEIGTLYSIEELKSLVKKAHDNDLYVHMDGSRLVNAAIALGCSLADLSSKIGIDILCFGGTKNGLMLGEAIIIFNKELQDHFAFIQKQNLQLAGKMRFVSAPFFAWLEDGVWQKYAKNALDRAQELEAVLREFPQIQVTRKSEVNSVFAIIPKKHLKAIRKKFYFYVWNEKTYECRLMTSFDTTKQDIQNFKKHLQEILTHK